MSKKKRPLNFSLLIFLVCLLFTFIIWDRYFNSEFSYDRTIVSTMVLIMGSLFSVSAGLFAWSLERSRVYAEAAAFESNRRQHIAEEAYRKMKEAHNRVVSAEKLATVGRLVAGVVHDVRNPLITSIGFLDRISDSNLAEEAAEMVSVVKRNIERCQKIVDDLLTFARERKLQITSVDPRAIIDEILDFLPLEFKKANIVLEKKFPEPFLIQADASQLRRVFMNLIVNSLQALQDVDRERRMMISIQREADRFTIVFQDNGPGISQENLRKIFDPFFTTKPSGKGTGLGLSLSHGIIQQHGGKIEVDSEPGKGVRFTIELPYKVPSGSDKQANAPHDFETNLISIKQGGQMS